MARVLVVHNDVGILIDYRRVLRAAGHEVATAALGEDAVAAVRRDGHDVVLADVELADMSGLDLAHEIETTCARTVVALTAASVTPELKSQAERAGAMICVTRPASDEELVRTVEEAHRLKERAVVAAAAELGYAARRWAELVIRGAYLPDDPKTVSVWCQGIALAKGTLKKRCEAVRVTPKDTLDLVRLLRVVMRHSGTAWDLQRRLDIVDDRTAEALMTRAGFCTDCPRVPTIDSFLSHQRLIETPELIDALREQLLRTSMR